MPYAQKKSGQGSLPDLLRQIALFVERGIHEIEVLLIHLFLGKAQPLAKALEVYQLALAQELDHIVHIRIVRQTQDVVVGNTRFLLCCNFVRTTDPKTQYLCGFSESAFWGSCNLISATYQKFQ